jgi:hypothetical protein
MVAVTIVSAILHYYNAAGSEERTSIVSIFSTPATDGGTVRGNGNTITESEKTINGNLNTIRGDGNIINGNSNVIYGDNNIIRGNLNTVHGANNRIEGNSNRFTPNAGNTVSGNLNREFDENDEDENS